MQEKISIIVPVYNVEKYIKKCIDSILAQTYKNYELLLINDGSTDNSGNICEEYRLKDNRITIINKENGGQADARNYGMEVAKGKYIIFIDADDYIDDNMLELLINPFLKYEDISFTSCGYYNVFLNDVLTNRNSGIEKILDKKQCEISLSRNKEICFMLWNKLFRRDILNNIRFIKGQLHEEIHFMREVCKVMNKCYYIDMPLYYYIRERDGNTESEFREQRLIALKEFDLFEKDMVIENNIDAAQSFSIMQMEFIISFYDKNKKNKQCKNQLKNKYNLLYKKNVNNIELRKKYKLFYYSPELFCWLIYLKNKIKKSNYVM